VPAAPAASCAKVESTRVRNHEFTGTPGIPARDGFTAYFVLSPATNSSCHRHRRIKGFAEPGRADVTSANLTPTTGARTTRLCRPQQHRSSACRVNRSRAKARPAIPVTRPTLPRPPHPAPTFVTMANAPPRDRTARVIVLIWVKREQGNFYKQDWTRQIRLIRFNKSLRLIIRRRLCCGVRTLPSTAIRSQRVATARPLRKSR
jgi:hypothetical protein